jgi:hypothetical protein
MLWIDTMAARTIHATHMGMYTMAPPQTQAPVILTLRLTHTGPIILNSSIRMNLML